MLRMSVKNGEFIMVGDDVKIVFLGGGGGQTRIMVDAPKEVNIVRSKAIEKRIEDPELLAKIPKYHTQEEHPEKYKPITEILTDAEIDKVFNKLMKFIDQENDTFDYYLCDEFGFTDRVPTTEEIKEWFKTLLYETNKVEEAKDEILSNDFESTF